MSVKKKLNDILHDNTNPLKAEFTSPLNIHSCHCKALKVCMNRYRNYFVPIAINVLNQRGRGQACFQMIEGGGGGEERQRADAITSGFTF